jgi:hypothetical protein
VWINGLREGASRLSLVLQNVIEGFSKTRAGCKGT